MKKFSTIHIGKFEIIFMRAWPGNFWLKARPSFFCKPTFAYKPWTRIPYFLLEFRFFGYGFNFFVTKVYG